MALAACLAFASCSKDDDNVPSVSFPELQTIECEVNSTTDISFESVGSWKLSSSALWCQFVVDGEQMHSYQGKAGKQTVKLMVTDDAVELMKSYTADITLEIDGQEKVIYKVTRPVAGYELHVMDAAQENEFSAENPVEMIYNGTARFAVSANYTWALVSAPDWVKVQNTLFSDANYNKAVCGTDTEIVTANADIVDLFKYLPREGELVFKSEDRQKTVTVPVVYKGMPEDEIDFSLANNSRYSWTFSADGFTLSTGSDMGSVTTMDAPMKIGVWAKDQKYEYVLLTRDEYGYMQMDPWGAWYFVDDFETDYHIEISAKGNTGAKRQGCVMVFPKAVYDKVSGNFDSEVLTSDFDIKPEYTRYVALDFTQAASTAGGFDILNQGWQEIPAEYLHNVALDVEDPSVLLEQYGTTNVWNLGLETPYFFLTIAPKGFSEESELGYTTILNGVDTKFGETVNFKPMGTLIGVSGLDQSYSGTMSITFTNNTTGEIVGVLQVNTWF